MSELREQVRGAGTVVRHEFRNMTHRPSFLVVTLAPAALAVVALAVFGAYLLIFSDEDDGADVGVDPRMVGYVDRTSEVGDALLDDYRNQQNVVFVPFADRDAGIAALADGEIDSLFVFAPQFPMTGQIDQIDLASDDLSEALGFDDYSYGPALRRFVLSNLFADQVPQGRVVRLTNPFVLSTHQVEPDGTPSAGVGATEMGRALFYVAAGIALVMSIFMSSGYLMNALSEEKENRVMEVLLSSVKPDALLLGKFVGLGAAGMLQMATWIVSFGIAIAVLNLMVDLPDGLIAVPPVIDIAVASAYFLLGYTFFGSILAAVGAATGSLREANQASAMITVPAFAPLWFMGVILPNPDGTLAQVLTYIPITAPVTAMLRRALDAMAIGEVIIALALMASVSFIGVVLAIRLFRAYLLMYGQRPSIAQIAKTVMKG